MSGVWMRQAREADEPAVRGFVPGLTGWGTTVSAMGAVVAVSGGEVVGVLIRWPHPDHILVELVAVAPGARRDGTGSLLLDLAEREAIECGVNRVRSRAAGGHVPLLLQHGFIRSGDVLEKRLTAYMP